MDERYKKCTEVYNLRSRKKPGYDLTLQAQAGEAVIAPKFNTAGLASLDSSLQPLQDVMLAQYKIQTGLKLFGQRGDDAIKREMNQLHNRVKQ